MSSILVVLFACGKPSSPPADKSVEDKPAEKPAALTASREAPAKPVDEAKPADEAKPEPAAQDSCEVALTNAYRVVESSGDAALEEMATTTPREQTIAQCQREGWSADLRSCLAAAKTTDVIYHDCYVRPLKDYPLTIKRTFDVSDVEAVRNADPKMFTLDGDYFQVAKDCGVLFVDTGKGGAGMFLTCDGKTRGPMTTPAELKEVFAMFSADLATQHSIVTSLISKAATGRFGGSWKVCDSFGNCHRE